MDKIGRYYMHIRYDIAIYKNKIYYSYQEDKQDFLGVMNTIEQENF